MSKEFEDKFKVSVMIPIRNRGNLLRHCLDSVMSQSYLSYEIILVDNNSTDHTKEVIFEYMNKFPEKNIKYVFERKIGRGVARNAGIEQATGDIIIMTDSDCVVPKDWIFKMTKPIREGEEVAVMGWEESVVKNFWSNHMQKEKKEHFDMCVEDKYITFIDTKNFAIKTPILKNFMFDTSLVNCEDFEFSLRFRKKNKVLFIPEIKVKHFDKLSGWGWFWLNFNRAYWTRKIYEKHKGDECIVEGSIFSIAIGHDGFINSMFIITWKFMTKPFKDTFYIFISALSWSAGTLYGYIK